MAARIDRARDTRVKKEGTGVSTSKASCEILGEFSQWARGPRPLRPDAPGSRSGEGTGEAAADRTRLAARSSRCSASTNPLTASSGMPADSVGARRVAVGVTIAS